MKRVLLVEDDVDLSFIAAHNLTKAGYQVDKAFTCSQAQSLIKENSYGLILLDVVLPDMRGTELCSVIRSQCDCPIIFMSCIGDSDVIITALKNGGDGYMVKPVDYSVLLARVDAIMRRSNTKSNKEEELFVKEFRSFSMDTIHRRISRNGEEIELSSIEYALLVYMVESQGTLMLYQDLYEKIWGNDSLGDIRTVMVHISNLRKKIDPDHIGIITTVRGAGYIFKDV